jgi:hypothetical protein
MPATDRRLWRALDERELESWIATEFPAVLPLLAAPGRREVLRAMAASLALAGLGGCGEGAEEAIPYVQQPPEIVPGVARFFATAIVFEGYAQPVLAETHEGRPTKLEGNPQHEASGGATDAFTQAAILQLYDPDRSAAPLRNGRPATWTEFERAAFELATTLDRSRGTGFRILMGDVTSPTLIRQIEELRRRWPEMRVHSFEPVGAGWRRRGCARRSGASSICSSALPRPRRSSRSTTIFSVPARRRSLISAAGRPRGAPASPGSSPPNARPASPGRQPVHALPPPPRASRC